MTGTRRSGGHKIRSGTRIEKARNARPDRTAHDTMPSRRGCPFSRSLTPPDLCPRAARCSVSISAPRPSASRRAIRTAASPRRSKPSRATLQSRRQAHSRTCRRTQGRGPCARPADQYGRQRRPARAVDARLRPQSRRSSPNCRSRSGTSGCRPPRSSARLIDADASRAKRKAVIDQHAATFILQGALDRLARGPIGAP